MLTCTSSSLNVTEIQWSYDGTELEGDGDRVKISYSNNASTLTINNVGEDDFGTYYCDIMDTIHGPITVFGYVNHTG